MKNVLEENIAFLIKLRDTMTNSACTIRDAMKKIVTGTVDMDTLNKYYRIKTYISIHGDIDYNNSILELIQHSKDLISEIDKIEVTYQTNKYRKQDYSDCFRTEISRIASGAFEEYGITTQEAFDSFYKKIPNTWGNVLNRAKTNWNRYMEYNNCPVEELNIKIEEEAKELKYLYAYQTIIKNGIKCDYTKLKEKIPMDKLSELLEIFSGNVMGIYSEYNDRRKKKNNPFYEVIIDKVDEKGWDKLTIKQRDELIVRKILQQEEKIEMIRQICSRKANEETAKQIQQHDDGYPEGIDVNDSEPTAMKEAQYELETLSIEDLESVLNSTVEDNNSKREELEALRKKELIAKIISAQREGKELDAKIAELRTNNIEK